MSEQVPENTPLFAFGRRHWPWLALLGAAIFVHLRELRGEVTYWRDVHLSNLPAHDYIAEMLKRGDFPQWWPFDGGGTPLLAVPPSELLHPSVALYALLPPMSALIFHGLLGTLFAMWGGYALARTLGQPKASAFVAGLVFGGNGYMACLVEQTFMLVSAATMPWYVASLVLAVRRGGAWLVAPAAMFALQVLAGDPQAGILAAFAGLAIVLAVRPGKRAILLGIASPLAGGVLSAAQILPAMLLVDQTDRALAPVWQDKWPLQAKHLAGFFVPVVQHPLDFIWSTFLGVAVVALAFASIPALRRQRVVPVLWGLVAVSIWLGLGKGYGLTELARAVVPLWGKFRYPVKNVLLALFAFSLLAGEGLRQLSGPRRVLARRAAAAAAGLGLVAGIVTIASIPWWIVCILAASAIAVVFVPVQSTTRAVVPLVVTAQLLAFTPPLIPVTAPSTFAEPFLAPILRANGAGLLGGAVERIDDSEWPLFQMADVAVAGVAGAGTSTGALWRIPALSAYSLSSSGRLRAVIQPDTKVARADAFRIYGALGTGFIILPFREMPKDFKRLGRDPDYGYAAAPIPGAMPRAYVSACARRVDTIADGVSRFRSREFDPHHEVLVEGEGETSCPPDGPVAVPAQVTARTNTTVDVAADAPWPGWLVLNESFFKGWTATVDGQPAEIRPANVAMRAIRLPAGRHEVRFSFRTPGFEAGAWVSLCGIVALVAAAFVLRRRAA